MSFSHAVSFRLPPHDSFILASQLSSLRMDDCEYMYVNAIIRQSQEAKDINAIKEFLDNMSGSTLARSLLGAKKLSISICIEEHLGMENLSFMFYSQGKFNTLDRNEVFKYYSSVSNIPIQTTIELAKVGSHIYLRLNIKLLSH